MWTPLMHNNIYNNNLEEREKERRKKFKKLIIESFKRLLQNNK